MEESLIVYVDMLSEPCQSILAFLRLSEIQFETRLINLGEKEFLSPEFTKINPFQEVPAISHGEYSLNESAAIVTYVAETFGVDNHWYPKDLKLRGRINAYLHWHQMGVRFRIGDYLMKKIFLPMFYGKDPMSEQEEQAVRSVALEVVSDLEWILSETGYVARTPTITIADIFAYSEVSNLKAVNIPLAESSRAKKWFDEIASLPLIQELQREATQFYSSIATPISN